MALIERLHAIADAIRLQSGKTELLTLEQMPVEIINLQSLNFEVVGNPKPDTPKENTLWVNTDTKITGWDFSAQKPKGSNLIDGLTFGNGYFAFDGAISGAASEHPEKYTNEYIPVRYGETYAWEYSVSASKQMWMCIVEYTGSYTFKQRITPVPSVDGTYQAGTYTPSAGDVTAVRLSWRTFSGTTCEVKFSDPNVEDIPEGLVWFPSGTASRTPFNAVKENSIMVYPSSAKQYVNGAWADKSAQTYQGGKWVSWWDGLLYSRGTFDQLITGGYTYYAGNSDCTCASEATGIRMYNEAYRTSKIVFNNKIDLTAVSQLKLIFDSVVTDYDGTTVSLIVGSNKGSSVNVLGSVSRKKAYDDEVMSGTLTLDVSQIDSGYVYVQFATTGNYNDGSFYIREVKAVLA